MPSLVQILPWYSKKRCRLGLIDFHSGINVDYIDSGRAIANNSNPTREVGLYKDVTFVFVDSFGWGQILRAQDFVNFRELFFRFVSHKMQGLV